MQQAFPRADRQLHRLIGTALAKLLQGAEGMTDDLVQLRAGGGELHRAATAFDQFDPEVPFQFLELPAELALPVGIVSGRRRDAAGGDDVGEGFQAVQREARLGEESVVHDCRVMLEAICAINKAEAFGQRDLTDGRWPEWADGLG